MKVIREDLRTVDAIISAMSKLRFDVSGPECMQLAASLQAFGALRQRIEGECLDAEKAHKAKVDAALAAIDAQAAAAASPTVPAAAALALDQAPNHEPKLKRTR